MESYKVKVGTNEFWYKTGTLNVLHRTDGPAAIKNQAKFYYFEGKLHREDGPAVVYKQSSLNAWYYYGVEFYPQSLKEFKVMTKLSKFT